MKLGCCISMLATTATQIGDENARLLSDLGYDYLELPLAQTMALSDNEFAQLNKNINSIGIPVDACNNFFPATLRLTGESADLGKALEYARCAADRAAQMGVEIIVLGSSGAKNIPEGFSHDLAKDQFVQLLRGLQPIVSPLGITIALEPLNRNESNFIINASEGLAIMKEADCENIRLLVDYYHMRMEDESFEVIKAAGKNLCHVHIAAKEGRVFPKQGDGEDYQTFFDTLKSVGYDARISVEAKSTDFTQDAEAASELLRKFM